jgi:hypothetical protein
MFNRIAELANMRQTRTINDNYQFDHQATPAIALPVHYAKKLALRTFDYFRFAVTNEYDTVSGNLRLAYHPDAEGKQNDIAMKDLIEKYLIDSRTDEADDSRRSPAPPQRILAPRSTRKNPWPAKFDKTMFYV